RSHGTGVPADSGACAAPAPRPRRVLETRAAALRRRVGEGPLRDTGDAPVPLVRPGRPRVPDRGTGTCSPRSDRVHVPPPGPPGGRRVERFLWGPGSRGAAAAPCDDGGRRIALGRRARESPS